MLYILQPLQQFVQLKLLLAGTQRPFECPPNRFHCNGTKLCLLYTQLCDGVDDCPDKLDEGSHCRMSTFNFLTYVYAMTSHNLSLSVVVTTKTARLVHKSEVLSRMVLLGKQSTTAWSLFLFS